MKQYYAVLLLKVFKKYIIAMHAKSFFENSTVEL